MKAFSGMIQFNLSHRPSSELLRLVFTSDGVIISVLVRSTELYDLMKIKPMESKAEYRFC